MMAYIFADYAAGFWDLGPHSTFLYALAVVVGLSTVNVLGVKFGKPTQNVLTAAKVLGLGGILVAGLWTGSPATLMSEAPPVKDASFSLAMILVLYTYGGWNDAAFVAAEQRDLRRNV